MTATAADTLMHNMTGAPKRTVAPTTWPVTLDEAKFVIGVIGADAVLDPEMTDIIKRATDLVELHSGRQLMPQTWQWALDRFPCDAIVLPKTPVRAVNFIKYYLSGVLTTWSSSYYQTDLWSEPARILPASGYYWPSADSDTLNAVQIEFTAGYASPAILTAEKPSAKAAVLEAVRHIYGGCGLSENYWTLINTLKPWGFL